MNLEDVTTSISVNKALHSLSCAVEPTPASNLSTGRDIIDNVEYKSFKEWFHHDKSAIQRSLASLVEKYSASSSGHEEKAIYYETTGDPNPHDSSKTLSANSQTNTDTISCTTSAPVRPWNYDDFLQRLTSFSHINRWFSKPDRISPIVCARYGWINVATDRLSCSTCRATIEHQNVTDTDGLQLYGQFTTHHEATCGWKDNPSPDSFADFQFHSREIQQRAFLERMNGTLYCLITYFGTMMDTGALTTDKSSSIPLSASDESLILTLNGSFNPFDLSVFEVDQTDALPGSSTQPQSEPPTKIIQLKLDRQYQSQLFSLHRIINKTLFSPAEVKKVFHRGQFASFVEELVQRALVQVANGSPPNSDINQTSSMADSIGRQYLCDVVGVLAHVSLCGFSCQPTRHMTLASLHTADGLSVISDMRKSRNSYPEGGDTNHRRNNPQNHQSADAVTGFSRGLANLRRKRAADDFANLNKPSLMLNCTLCSRLVSSRSFRKQPLLILDQHRSFCPFVSTSRADSRQLQGESQDPQDSLVLPGWKQCLVSIFYSDNFSHDNKFQGDQNSPQLSVLEEPEDTVEKVYKRIKLMLEMAVQEQRYTPITVTAETSISSSDALLGLGEVTANDGAVNANNFVNDQVPTLQSISETETETASHVQ